jgi:hypothetical protein
VAGWPLGDDKGAGMRHGASSGAGTAEIRTDEEPGRQSVRRRRPPCRTARRTRLILRASVSEQLTAGAPRDVGDVADVGTRLRVDNRTSMTKTGCAAQHDLSGNSLLAGMTQPPVSAALPWRLQVLAG